MTHHTIAVDGKLFFDKVERYLDPKDCAKVKVAFEMARREHGEQTRKSGELFFTHPLTVAYYLAEYMLDAPALIAALLHDVAEDTKVSIEDIETAFGSEVATLVDGVTKLKRVTQEFNNGRTLSKEDLERATLHKLLGVMMSDVRAVIIKLFDRLHNMRTIGATPRDRQIYKANETLSVYAPLANRLGIWEIKNELEALSLEVIDGEDYNEIKAARERLILEQSYKFPRIENELITAITNADLQMVNVLLAPENVPTLYRDCKQTQNGKLDQTMRIVILLDDWQSCYTAMGIVHSLWKPVPDTFDDYIAFPRNNLYRSLHTTVMHTDGFHLKVRLRTVPMHKVSEVGVLARWLYKGTSWYDAVAKRQALFLENISENMNVEPKDPLTGIRGVVQDVFNEEQIEVYTPRGMLVELAKGATPIDFAYAIHTGLGNQCYAATVGEEQHPLNEPLKNGDKVQIIKRLGAQPQRAWLDEDLGYISTTYAMTHARRWFRRLSEETAVSQGRTLLQSELDMLGLPLTSHWHIASLFEYDVLEKFYHDIGRADILPTEVATRLLEEKWQQIPTRSLDKLIYSDKREPFFVKNADNRDLRRCSACRPRPPQSIVGYIRKDAGVTVHEESCHTLPQDDVTHRILKLQWGDSAQRRARLLTFRVKVYDRPGLLYEMTHLMQQEGVNITFVNTPPAPKGEVHLIFTLETTLPRQFVRILHRSQALINVFEVRTLESHVTPDQQIPATSLYRPE